MKKIWFMIVLCGVFLMSGCGIKEEVPEENMPENNAQGGRITPESKPAEVSDFPEFEITVYYPDEGNDIRSTVEMIYNLDVGQLLVKLTEYKVLPEDLGFIKLEEAEAEGIQIVKLDMKEEFQIYLEGITQEEEELVIKCFVNTMLSAYDAERIYITVEDREIVTRSETKEDYFTFYDI